MQRAEALQPLSRDHKSALMTCLLIRKGVSKHAPVAEMADFFLSCWHTEIAPHFAKEEEILIPILNNYPQGKLFAETILRDHELIRTGVVHLGHHALNERLLDDLAKQLEQHIRYEERLVFQEIQQFIPASELAKIHFLENAHPAVCNNYPNHFWE
jgi:iron-sulfur cluster repair protein YtfE (RIC family)